jgi:hypothetical protein
LQPLQRVLGCVGHFKQNHLLGGVLEPLRLKPLPVPGAPCLLARVDPSVAQHHRRDRLALATQVVHRGLAGADQFPDGLVPLVGDPDRRELAGSMQAGQLRGVPPVGFHPVARLARDERGRDHRAAVAHRDQLPVEPVARRPSFVAEMQPAMALGELGNHPAHGSRVRIDLAQIPNFASSP